jgi:hypothetical protein
MQPAVSAALGNPKVRRDGVRVRDGRSDGIFPISDARHPVRGNQLIEGQDFDAHPCRGLHAAAQSCLH